VSACVDAGATVKACGVAVDRPAGEKLGTDVGQQGIGTETVRNWVNQAGIDGGQRPGRTSEEQRRLAELEKENRELRRDHAHRSRRGCCCGPVRSFSSTVCGRPAPGPRLG
jgi:hypothetical protein